MTKILPLLHNISRFPLNNTKERHILQELTNWGDNDYSSFMVLTVIRL